MPRKTKRTPLEILRARERKNRLVPPIVVQRRRMMTMALNQQDPALPILSKAKRLSNKHAKILQNLMIRSMGLLQTTESVAKTFAINGLDDIKMDASAQALISNAVRKVSEILIFQMVTKELVNDKAMVDKLTELFVHQRFAAMVAPTPPNAPPERPTRPSRTSPEAKQELLHTALAAALDL